MNFGNLLMHKMQGSVTEKYNEWKAVAGVNHRFKKQKFSGKLNILGGISKFWVRIHPEHFFFLRFNNAYYQRSLSPSLLILLTIISKGEIIVTSKKRKICIYKENNKKIKKWLKFSRSVVSAKLLYKILD